MIGKVGVLKKRVQVVKMVESLEDDVGKGGLEIKNLKQPKAPNKLGCRFEKGGG